MGQKTAFEQKAALSLDVRGLICPIPVQKTDEAIKQIEPGEVLEVIASDPLTLIDIPAWEAKEPHKILRVVDEWLTIRFYIQRGK